MSEAQESSLRSGSRMPRHCDQCSIRHRAMCAAVDFDHLGMLEQIVSHRRYAPGQAIFEESEAADYVYNVSNGDVCLYKLLADGRRQITGFLRPGDFLGLVKQDVYTYGAEAIDDVELCCMRIVDLERLLREMPAVRDRLLDMSRDEMAAAQEQMLLLGRKSAREKVLSFLLLRAKHDHDLDETEAAVLDLPMSRSDIADYLGLTIETVSRTFTALKEEGLIDLPSAQHVVLSNLEAIEAAANAD